ncbi:MAG: hypothetical protein PHG97_04985, partial [Candidatus Margulisbacteria bacterium]|nr:hypothetical protein [Candidatus Margulisiibacteriota bacterium]
YDHGEITKNGFLDVLEGKGKKPQIITKKLGKGKVVYANFSLFLKIKTGSRKLLAQLKKSL